MNRSRTIILAIALVVAALAFVGWLRSRAPEAPRFRTAAVERGSIESQVSATGTVRPVVQVEIGSQVSGTVAELFADYNSQVRKGQVLLQIESSSFRARQLQAEAAVARAEAALLDGQRQFRRAKELISENYVSQADVEAAEVQVRQREADVKQARAQLEVARVDLANTTIRAPVDGVVISRSIDRGQTVAASLTAPKLFVIANDLHAMQIETRIDESDIGVIRPGLPATFTVDAFPDVTFRGEVQQVRLEPIVEQNVVTYTTVIQTRNPDLRLRPGMTANVTVRVARRDDVIRVPNAALRFKPPVDPKRGTSGRGAGERGGRDGSGRAGPGGSDGGVAVAGPREGAPTHGMGGAMPGGRARGAGGGMRGMRGEATPAGGATEPPAFKPGTVYVLRGGKPVPVEVLTGITDGAYTEVRADALQPGGTVIVGLDVTARGNLRPPPGMGGPMMGGGGRR